MGWRTIGALLIPTALLMAAQGTTWAQPAPPSTPIVITEIRPLDFGGCDIVNGVTYTVAPAENPGLTGCTGSSSAKFQVTGEPSTKVKITLSKNVSISNGIDTLTVQTSQSPSGGNISFDAGGNLTIYVGGDLKIPPGGLGSSGQFSAMPTLDVSY